MLRKCCFCVDLKKGGIIIAWISIFLAVFFVLIHISLLSNVEYFLDETLRRESKVITEKEKSITMIKIIATITIVMYIIDGITSVLLLLGIQKSRPQQVRIWLIVIPILTVFEVIFSWFYLMPKDTLIVNLTAIILGVGLIAYFYCVIYSLYKENEM